MDSNFFKLNSLSIEDKFQFSETYTIDKSKDGRICYYIRTNNHNIKIKTKKNKKYILIEEKQIEIDFNSTNYIAKKLDNNTIEFSYDINKDIIIDIEVISENL